ncbi:hypothetical protein Tco_0857208 [Tanacetum coccineum]|uniref:Uncharacterized protein n=1 Tax=Tanacetum coccineum TaxID=301880 RepID=A0ABQ5B6G6_9ASTR
MPQCWKGSHASSLLLTFLQNLLPKNYEILARSMAPVYAPSFVSAPSFDKAIKGQGIQESNDKLERVLERGSLNCGGDRVLVGCVKDFKTLPNIYNEIRDSDHRILHDSLLEIDSRLDKGDGRPTDAINRIHIFHDIGVSDNKISIDLAKKDKVKWAIE